MKFYFFSPIPSCLLYKGESHAISRNLFAARSVGKTFFRVIPPADTESCSFISDDERFDDNIRRLPFFDGQLVIPIYRQKCKAISEQIATASVTAFGVEYAINAHIDGFIKLSVTSYRNFAEVLLPIRPKSLEAIKQDGYLIVNAKSDLNALCVFSLEPLKCLKTIVCCDYSVGDTLSATKAFRGVTDLVVREHYSLKNGFAFLGKDVLPKKDCSLLPSKLLKAQAFFETVAAGGDPSPYLDRALINDVDGIRGFLEGVEHVIPPNFTDFPDLFALVGRSVRYARPIFGENDRIADIDVEE